MACARTSFLYSLDKYWSFVLWLCRFDKLMDRRASPFGNFNCRSDCVCCPGEVCKFTPQPRDELNQMYFLRDWVLHLPGALSPRPVPWI